jgi:lipopolysaccharide/colanic/teichoic acid biosynthesis glycosyltransferase
MRAETVSSIDAVETRLGAPVREASGGGPRRITPVVVRLRPDAVAPPAGVYVRAVKPMLDRVIAVSAAIVAVIPMMLIAAVVALSMGRPVLFRQRRVGRDGVTFEVLKFRTMRPDRRGRQMNVDEDRRTIHKSERDPRHTRVGRLLRKYSLDELPQIFNVLRGDMSIVGPRPELPAVVEQYPPGLARRHAVKPGLTGLWQINARGDGPMHEHGEWDLAYVERVSLRTDMSIMIRTPKAILGENAGT